MRCKASHAAQELVDGEFGYLRIDPPDTDTDDPKRGDTRSLGESTCGWVIKRAPPGHGRQGSYEWQNFYVMTNTDQHHPANAML